MEPICPTSCCQCRRRAVSKRKKAPMTRLKCDSRHSSPPLRLSASPPRRCSANYTIFSIPTILRFIFRRPNERRMTPYLFFSAWTWRAGCLFFRTISVCSGLSVEKSISSFGKQLDGLDQNDATQIFITRIIFIAYFIEYSDFTKIRVLRYVWNAVAYLPRLTILGRGCRVAKTLHYPFFSFSSPERGSQVKKKTLKYTEKNSQKLRRKKKKH